MYFCLAVKNLFDSLRSKLALGYLDDATVGNEAPCMLQDSLYIEAAAKRLGLQINRLTREVVWHTEEMQALFAAHNVVISGTSASKVILLGTSMSASQHLHTMLQRQTHRAAEAGGLTATDDGSRQSLPAAQRVDRTAPHWALTVQSCHSTTLFCVMPCL